MVSRLERWAEDARANGFVDEAMTLENQAKVFRKAGVPDEFSSETTEGRLKLELDIGELPAREIMRRLIEVFSSAEIHPHRPPLNSKLAEQINDKVGRYLSDDVAIQELRLTPGRIDKRAKQIWPNILSTYNRILSNLDRANYSTIGSVRDASPSALMESKNIKAGTIVFAQIAFARPQPPEGQA